MVPGSIQLLGGSVLLNACLYVKLAGKRGGGQHTTFSLGMVCILEATSACFLGSHLGAGSTLECRL